MTDDVSAEVIKNTQKVLGKYVKKPPLTEKLLKKPPFRFLHDVIVCVVKETGFLKGLYSDGELHSDNVKDREAKISFLNKLIDATKSISQVDLQVRASKIIAGLEPTETNLLLQAIGTAIDSNLSSKEYVASVKETTKAKNNKNNDTSKEKARRPSKTDTDRDKKKTTKTTESKPEKSRVRKQDSEQSTNRSDKQRRTSVSSKKEPSPRQSTNNKPSPKESSKHKKEKENSNSKNSSRDKISEGKTSSTNLTDTSGGDIDVKKEETIFESIENASILQPDLNKTQEVPPEVQKTKEALILNNTLDWNDTKNDSLVNVSDKTDKKEEEIVAKIPMERPKSARPRSGDYKKDRIPSAKPKPIIDLDKEMKIESSPVRPKSSLRPPTVRPTSARPGAPRLRPDSALPLKEMVPLGKINVIVENYSAPDDEEETVVIQSAPEVEPEPQTPALDIPADRGHLVEQILEQLHEDDVQDQQKAKVDIQWETEGFRGRESTNKEINQLRNAIQTLTRTANPLGKLMNFLHEDMESMHLELNMWITTKRQIKAEIANQKRLNEDVTKPLKTKLFELEESILKQENEIASLRANILRNDIRIKELLSDHV